MARRKKDKPETPKTAPEERADFATRFQPGNQFWKARSTHGRKPIFETPDILWAACVEYFEWVENNPLYECKAFHASGVITKTDVPKMRAMTIAGLCLFLDISIDAWEQYRKRPDFVGVCSNAEQIIYQQKFTGAAADLLNPVIIARELGLKDKQELEHTGKDGGPIQYTDTERAARLTALLHAARTRRDRQTNSK